jgi:hypothetical protein
MQEHLAKRAKPGHGAAMSPASRSPALRPWRAACLALLCAAAGGGLRWRLQTNGTAPSGPAATDQKARPPLTPTADALRSLSVTYRLTSLAAALPNMTVADIAALVESLAARVQEGGMGPGTADIELLLRVAFTRWAELDAPGMISALEAPAYQYALTTRMIAVRAWAELRGIAALEGVKAKWPGVASRVAWEVLERRRCWTLSRPPSWMTSPMPVNSRKPCNCWTQVRDPDAQRASLEAVLPEWLEADPAAARAAFDAAPLTALDRERWEQRMDSLRLPREPCPLFAQRCEL